MQHNKSVKIKNFEIDIDVVDDGKNILDTGGGILNMINYTNDNNFIILFLKFFMQF